MMQHRRRSATILEPPRPRRRVLSIDDDPNIAEAMARPFRRRGIDVFRAYDGVQGVWLAATEKPDLIVLDLTMPNGAGHEVLECLRRNAKTRAIPVLVLTGNDDPHLRRVVQRLGAEGYFVKPTPVEELLEAIERLLAARITV